MTKRANRDLPFNRQIIYGTALELESFRAGLETHPEVVDQASVAAEGLYGLAYGGGERRLVSRRALDHIHRVAASRAAPYTPQTYEEIDNHYAHQMSATLLADQAMEDWQ